MLSVLKEVCHDLRIGPSQAYLCLRSLCMNSQCSQDDKLSLVEGCRREEGGGKGSSAGAPMLLAEPQEKWDLCRHTIWPERYSFKLHSADYLYCLVSIDNSCKSMLVGHGKCVSRAAANQEQFQWMTLSHTTWLPCIRSWLQHWQLA